MFRIVVLVALLAGCVRRGAFAPAPADRAEAAAELEQFEAYWLAPARLAPPTIPFEPQQTAIDGLSVTVRPLLPEDANWNQWRGGELRLFNNRAALMFDVEVAGEGRFRWLPEATRLVINGGRATLPAAASPDELLVPLMRGALLQESAALDGDLVERTRAAGAFRSAYLASADSGAPAHGVIAFPLGGVEYIVDATLVFEVLTPSGRRNATYTFD